MSFVDSLKKGLFGSEDDYDDQYMDDGPQMVNNNNGIGTTGADEEDAPEEAATPKRNGKVVNIHATTQLKVVLVKPEHFEDASTIADHLNNKRTVVLNLESTNKEVSSMAPSMGTGRRRPDSSGSPSSIFWTLTAHTEPSSPATNSSGETSGRTSTPSALAWCSSARRQGISSSVRR